MDTKKKITVSLVASLTSVSLLLGNIFDSSKDLLDNPKTPKAMIESTDDYSEDDQQNNEKKDSIKQKIKNLIYKIPIKVRAFFFLPLWLLGNLLISLLTPLMHIILSFLLQTLIMFIVVVLCIKILFPDIPLSKLLNKKLFLCIILSSLFIKLCDYFIPMFWADYNLYRNIIRFVLGLIFILIILKPFIKKKIKDGPVYEIIYDKESLKII